MIALDAPPAFSRRGSGGAAAILATPFSVLTGTAVGGTLIALGLFFLKAGAFIFGSGLAIVPFLKEGVVSQHHWLTEGQFLDAVAIGLITPGPVVITAAFIGYLVGGLTGALVATVAIFTPIYLGVVLPGKWFVRHKDNPASASFREGGDGSCGGRHRRCDRGPDPFFRHRLADRRDPRRQFDPHLAVQEQGTNPCRARSRVRRRSEGFLNRPGNDQRQSLRDENDTRFSSGCNVPHFRPVESAALPGKMHLGPLDRRGTLSG